MDRAYEQKPPLRARIWRALGWRYHLVDLPVEADAMPGWAMTCVQIHLSRRDRLRLLLTGRLNLDIQQAFDVPVRDVVSATSIRLVPPGGEQ